MRNLIWQHVQQKIAWQNVPKKVLQRWVDNVEERVACYSPEVSEFQLAEILHYATLQDVQDGYVPVQGEQRYLLANYENIPAIDNPTQKLLQSPEITFGVVIESPPCPKCRETNVTATSVQDRKSDEATSTHYHCPDCGHAWKVTG